MGINPNQLLRYVIKPALTLLDMESPAAEALMLGTVAQESHCGRYLHQLGKGPALGIFQMEPTTYRDIWENYIAYRQRAATKTVTTNHETAEVLSTIHSWGGITNGGYIRAPACFGSNQATLNTEYISNWWFYTGYGNPQTKLHTLPTDW